MPENQRFFNPKLGCSKSPTNKQVPFQECVHKSNKVLYCITQIIQSVI